MNNTQPNPLTKYKKRVDTIIQRMTLAAQHAQAESDKATYNQTKQKIKTEQP